MPDLGTARSGSAAKPRLGRLGSESRSAIAHVGYTGSDDDRERKLAVEIWLERNDTRVHASLQKAGREGTLREDCFDLNQIPPHDFLTEGGCYDLVVLHNLWGYRDLCAGGGESGPTACSRQHSVSTWRRRLLESKATYIFLFGSDFNLGFFDGVLSGYEAVAVPSLLFLGVFTASPPRRLEPVSLRELAAAKLRCLEEFRLNHCLDLSHTAVRHRHAVEIAKMSHLRDLLLVGTAIDDSDLALIAHDTLESLYLDETAISDQGLSYLQRCSRLRCLSLNDTKITDNGLRHLRELKHLECLSLTDTAIGDAAIDHLLEIRKLRSLSLSNTGITLAGAERLRRALPACAVAAPARQP